MPSGCKGCGGPLAPNRNKGRPRVWCSERCRKAQYGGLCVDCGAPTDGSYGRALAPERCNQCNSRIAGEREAKRATEAARPNRDTIARMWRAGHTAKEISEATGMVPASVHTAVTYMRNSGVDLPFHRRGVTSATISGARDLHRKLTDEQVEAIKASPLSNRAAAIEFGVHDSTISRVRRGYALSQSLREGSIEEDRP